MELVNPESSLREIVGDSVALKSSLRQARDAAKTELPVIVVGEAGSGKELIARAIHCLGSRRRQSFIKFDCVAVTTAELEQALFGHGGRLGLANLGTLLIQRLELVHHDLRSKMLQFSELDKTEPLIDAAAIPIDVRLILTVSETGLKDEDSGLRNLAKNALIVRVPPLRERQTDIPQLVGYFAKRWASWLNKSIDVIPPETMESLVNHSWPNNVRELENEIGRLVRTSQGRELRFKAPERRKGA